MKSFLLFLFFIISLSAYPDARTDDLQNRWNAIYAQDPGMPCYFRAYPSAGPNAAAFFIDKILNGTPANAETRMAKIEAEWALILQERAAAEAAEAAAKLERQEIKTYIQTINDSDLPAWHKKILKVLIREMRD